MNAIRRRAWVLLLILALIAGLFSLGAVFSGVDPNEFEQSTGVGWTDLMASAPTVAAYLSRLVRLIGIGFGFAGIAWAGMSWLLLRLGRREGWTLLWTMPAAFAGAAFVFFGAGAPGLGGYYAGLAVLAVLGLLLSPRTPARKPTTGT
jgi:hypothetical protein